MSSCEVCNLTYYGDSRMCQRCRDKLLSISASWDCKMCGTPYGKGQHFEGDAKWPLCFECDHFCELLARHDGLIVERVHYVIGPEPKPGQMFGLGHAGTLFKFRSLSDGSIVESRNVWCQGTFPTHFKVHDTHEVTQ